MADVVPCLSLGRVVPRLFWWALDMLLHVFVTVATDGPAYAHHFASTCCHLCLMVIRGRRL